MSTQPASVSILGVSGFSGVELAKLVAAHPAFDLAVVAADRWQGKLLGDCIRVAGPAARLRVVSMDEGVKLARQTNLAALATPAEVSMKLAPQLVESGVRVVDLSGAFRLTNLEDYPRWYNFEHSAPELVAQAHYGLPEVAAASSHPEGAASARLIANPGCYATAAIVALAPLVRAGLIELDGIFIDGKSGVSGAGRKVEERLTFMEVAENVSPYRVGDHQHTPEIEQALGRIASAPVRVTFVPHLLPVKRGLIVTTFARLVKASTTADEVELLYRRQYDLADSLVEVTSPGNVSLSRVAYTPLASVGVRALPERSAVVVVSALDNLMKGAASQALQNMCAMIGSTPGFSRGNP